MNASTSEIKDHRETVWAQLSRELGGEFINGKGWAQDHVRVQHENWDVTLDFELHAGYRAEYIHTRFRSPVSPSPFGFRVFHQDLIHTVGRLFGLQDLAVGDSEFDKMFVVQTSDEEKTRHLFQDAALRKLMSAEPELEIALRVPSKCAPADECGCDELSLQVPEIVEDKNRLRRLFDVFAHLVHDLRKLGYEPC